MSWDKRSRPDWSPGHQPSNSSMSRVPCSPPLSRLCGQVPLARSETHLSELLDGVCNSMTDYALHVDPDTQFKQYMRFAPRSSGTTEDFPDFKNFQFNGPEASNALKFACETVVEELEDDIISLFSRDTEHVHEELCNRVSEHCKDSSHTNEEL
ncbi:protein canopy-1 [Morone saxatilis]|uniref:protein canopy-1 n=1 Tax=Morone saxatilis TaxID=34816 RepID=UPI0015E1C9EA|nr:protein canopy-1 [Morone saxatilis]